MPANLKESAMSETDQLCDTQRRAFLGKSAVALAGVTVAPGMVLYTVAHAKDPAHAVSPKNRWGMLIETSKCASNCDACVDACHTEHGIVGHNRPETDPQWIRKVTLKHKHTGREVSLPLMCQHCEKPPCVDVCPTGASFKRVDGIVLVDKHICIGCRYCMMACPYKARSFVHEALENQKPHSPRGKGTVESCNFCVKRIDDGRLPACVDACNSDGHQAMLFGDLNDPDSALNQKLRSVQSTAIRNDLGLNPGIRYEGL
jgi:tetrathionate reductase subunit B